MRYEPYELNQGEWHQATSFWRFWENFVHSKLVNYTEQTPKNGQKWPKVVLLQFSISHSKL